MTRRIRRRVRSPHSVSFTLTRPSVWPRIISRTLGSAIGVRSPAARRRLKVSIMGKPPFCAIPSADRVMHGHKLRAVGKGDFDLNIVNHLRHTVHTLLGGDDLRALLHQIGHGPAVACAFDDEIGDQRDRLGWLSFTPRASRLRATVAARLTRSLSFSLGLRFISLICRGRGRVGSARRAAGARG
mgnify:CR=1 FL=1